MSTENQAASKTAECNVVNRKPIRVVVIISDLHLGSIHAILQPDFVTEDNQPVGQTPEAKWFYECWKIGHQWLSGIVNPKEYALIINGDIIEGNHHRTTEIWSPQTRNHSKAAKELLKPVANRAAKVIVVSGTECHVGDSEISIAEYINAEKNPETLQPIWQRAAIRIAGVKISVRHHFPATTRSYLEGAQHSIQLGNSVNEAVRCGDDPPTILVGAHRHRTGHFVNGNQLTVITGAWQGLTRHGFKIVPDGRPCPSIYVLDWRDKDDGELPTVHFRRFNPPKERVIEL